MLTLHQKREVVFYKTSSGKCPVTEFLDALPAKAAQKVTWVLRLIEDLHTVPAQYFIKMRDTADIWECRIKRGSNIYRIYAFWDGHNIVLTNGIIKKSQKAPKDAIIKAEGYKKDYLSRKDTAA